MSNLFGTDTSDLSSTGAADSVSQLTLSKIEPNPNQPRKKFDQQALEELAESIRLHGVITPITVRARGTSRAIIRSLQASAGGVPHGWLVCRKSPQWCWKRTRARLWSWR